jgi:hypothetical protein
MEARRTGDRGFASTTRLATLRAIVLGCVGLVAAATMGCGTAKLNTGNGGNGGATTGGGSGGVAAGGRGGAGTAGATGAAGAGTAGATGAAGAGTAGATGAAGAGTAGATGAGGAGGTSGARVPVSCGDAGACVAGAIDSVGRPPDQAHSGALPDGGVATVTDDGFEVGGTSCNQAGSACVTGAITP